ncbi:DUF11 domain-containing protein [Calothrix sp. PCC 6303]|uniref:DUF11 domain-containing protein n=1 Tax=Calothrix sp. PCC 6303 TaxID=1170562 RepID=UPI0002A02B2B|nr:DUF11 domain-containing protein [Calothrix sp. PCC 6303]AFZ01189.1 conserved repeat domain protein [Calothrix sp. PCC 6303]
MKTPITHLQRIQKPFTKLTLLLCTLSCWVQPAKAEGSRELVQNGGNRPFTEWRTDRTAGILRRTVLKVYVNKDEVINLGSSAVGVDKGDILLFKDGDNVDSTTPTLKCSTAVDKGILDTRAKEIAGPLPTTGGYTPCTYTAPASGVYQVVFYGTDGKTSTTDPTTANGVDYITNPLTTAAQKSAVSMWDITVRSSATSTSDIKGRVFTDYIALNMGANNRYLKSNIYILTDDGYRYSTDLSVGRGIDPYGFLFFANEKGLLAPNGQPLYHTGKKAGDSAMTPPLDGGVTIQAPKYPLFFNPPSNDAISGLNVSLIAREPFPASNFKFTGGVGGSGNQTPESVGGTFSFDAPQSGGFQIIIDADNDGNYNTASSDRILEGSAVGGSNTIIWDGKDGGGNVLPARPGNAPYNARITLKGGEYHFPLIDAESAADGFKIEMLNPPGPFSNGANQTTIYFDERDYKVSETDVTLGCSLAAGLPVCDGRGGVDSALGAHKFGTNTGNSTDYGDRKAIDTWIYFPSSAVLTPLIIIPPGTLTADKTVALVVDSDKSGGSTPLGSQVPTPGDILEYTVIVKNTTTTTQRDDVVLKDTIPVNTTYVPGTLHIDGTIKTDGTGDDQAEFASSETVFRLGTGANATTGGTLAANATSTIKFRVKVNDPLPNGVTKVSNQAVVSSNGIPNINSNDPGTPTADDPTVTKIAPRLRLVKRVTGIKKASSTAVTPVGGYNDLATDVNDDAAVSWTPNANTYLLGAIASEDIPTNPGAPAPQDEVEYTIYFLVDGGITARDVDICDFIPANQTYVDGTMELNLNGGTTSAIADTPGASGGFYPPTTTSFPDACSGTNNSRGASHFKVGNLNSNSYGYVRFRAKVN